jgi:hypothetical protein|tara:strand:+ start:1267 stop:3228 length:1962 start_codon:yes stop_codon:yes gene_type:complete
MAENNMTYAEGSQILEAVRVLEALEASGEISPTEQSALDGFRDKRKPAQDARVETISTYRGAQAGASLNLADEIAGAYGAANELLRNRDIAGAKSKYAEYRDLVRQKDEAAKMLAPEQFAKGQGAGMMATSVLPAGGAATAMRGMGAAGRVLMGAGTGGAMTALPDFAEGEGGFPNRVANVSPISTGIGAAMGGLAPVAGAGAGALVRGAQNMKRGVGGFSAPASQRVARSLNRAEASGEDIQKYLDGLGPEGMVADIPGSPQKVAQGLASMQGEGSDILQRNIRERSAGAGGRIEETMSRRIDEPEAAFQKRIELAEERSSVLGPMYDAATASGQTFKVDALRSGISFIGKDAASNVKKRLNTALKDLGTDGDVSAERLHNARSALSEAMYKAKIKGEGGVVRNLKPIIEDVDARLDEIPGYLDARTGYANNKELERAIDAGRKAFTGGATTALSPKMLSEALSKMSPAQRDAYKKGAREYISALMGTSSNDAAAAWREFGKNWNAEKLRAIVGEEDATEITRRLLAEKEFSKTRSAVMEGTQTSQRTEAREALADVREPDTANMPSPVTRIRRGIEAPINKAINEVLYGPRRSSMNRQIGEILSLQGDQRDAAVSALMTEARRLDDPTRAQAIIEALTTAGMLTASPAIAE